jgi:hypothetical protein
MAGMDTATTAVTVIADRPGFSAAVPLFLTGTVTSWDVAAISAEGFVAPGR